MTSHPIMHSERLRKAEAAFHALVDLAPEQRARTITDLCGDDKELRVFVERLLASHDSEAAAVLRTPVYGAPAVGRHRVKADAPERIGRYKIIRLLGQGGMGVVYLAEQTEPLRRQVALKLIKVGMDTRQVIARFEAERQTLAMMNHPNVAGVFDAGVTEDDRPFFVMEYVPGLMITGYCDVNGLTVPERLGLFLKVCDGIQHAHQKGVIHRDLKPGNILVDEQGRPKILDFGVARLTNSDVQAVTMQTAVGQLVGTIPYMSPEQVTGVSANVDTRSDVYALGMICYKLLTGNLPYDIQDRSIPEAVRIIREEEPTRLSSVDTHFRGDLDTIIIKALQKDKARRYQSASELAADLRNYLENRPIAARPPTTFYQLRMFARRNKPLVGGVLATFMALLIGIAGIAVQATRVTRERDNARQAERLADTRRDLAERRAYAAHIAAAQAALRANDVVIARQRLDAASPDLRNWEWRYMASRLDASSATLASHDRYVWSVTYGPDGSWLASGSTDETVKLWDIASGHVVQTMSAGARVQGVSVSPDGRRVVAATENGLLQVWSSSSGDKLMTMSDHTEAVSDAAFSPNGRLIASAACDATVRIWDADTGECRLVLEHPSWVHDVCFTSDSTRLATSCRDNVARLWDLSTHLPVAEIQVLPSSADWDFVHSWAVAVDPNGQVLATGAHDGVIKLWSVATGGLLEVLEGHTSRVRSLEFSSDAARLASGSDDCTVRLWNPSTGIGLATLLGHEGAVFSVGFSPDSKRLASASADHTVRIWDARGSSQLNRIWGHGNLGIPALAISPDGTQIISGGVDGVVQLWETESQTPTAVIHGHQGKVYAVTFSPDGEYAASGARDGTVRIWETAGGTEFGTLIGHEGAVTAVVFLSHATRLASAAKDGTIKVWDSASHAEVMTMRSETEQFTALACSPDARQLVSGSSTGFIEFWDAEAGRRLNAVHGHQGEVTSVNYSPDGTRFVTASSDRTLRMWCPRTAVSTTMLQGHTDLVADAAFSPDGTRVASVSRDRMLRLWDPDTGETVLSFKAHQDWPASVAFSPDGAWLVSSGKSIRIWKATKPARQIIE